jgi:DNA-binding MarR family transcriptional regulator
MPAASLTDHTGYWLRMVSNAVSHDFARRIAGQGVTVAEWVFLRALHDVPELAPTALAERMSMTRGAISKLADRLAAKGLLAIAQTPGARGQGLSLTEAGRALVPVLARLADENDADWFGPLSGPDRAELARLLQSLAARRGLTTPPLT